MAAKVLIVEDEPVIALEIQSILSSAGFAIAGCVASVDKALAVLEHEECDAAVLDANLQGESIEAVALVLDQRNTPFCFVSGYGRVYLPAPFQDAPLLSKPFAPDALVQAVSRLLA
jgi:DNA-binding response OmpR family regulator